MRLEVQETDELWTPNEGGQQHFMDDYQHRYVAFAGGWFAGKTWAGARKLADMHVYNGFEDSTGRPTFVKGLIVAPTFGLARTVCIPEMQNAFDEMGLNYRFVADPKRFCFELPDLGTRKNPSEILVRSAAEAGAIAGFTVGHVWGDEAGRWEVNPLDPLRDPFLQIEGRVRAPRAKVLQINYTFTHEGDATSVYRDFEEKIRPDHVLYRGGTFENPYAKEFGENLQRKLTPELAKQYLGGEAASLRGAAIYSSYHPGNRDDSVEWIPGIPVHLSIDFNIEPGMHGLVGQEVPQKDMLIAFLELHHSRMDVRTMMAEFHKWWLPRQQQIPELHLFGDASGNSKWAGNGESCWDVVTEVLRKWGVKFKIKVPGSNPHVADRVIAFNCVLNTLDGTVRYKAHSRCVKLHEDFRFMKWKQGEVDKSDRKLSHPSDAEGYRVHWLRPIIRPRTTGGGVGVVSNG